MIAIAEKVELSSKLSKSQRKKKAAQKKKVFYSPSSTTCAFLVATLGLHTASYEISQRAKKVDNDNGKDEALKRTIRLKDEIDARIVCFFLLSTSYMSLIASPARLISLTTTR